MNMKDTYNIVKQSDLINVNGWDWDVGHGLCCGFFVKFLKEFFEILKNINILEYFIENFRYFEENSVVYLNKCDFEVDEEYLFSIKYFY